MLTATTATTGCFIGNFNETPKRPLLQILGSLAQLGRPAAEVDSLRPLPSLGAEEEQQGFDEDDAPFP